MRVRYLLIAATIIALSLLVFIDDNTQAQGGAYVDLAQVTNDDFDDFYPDVSPDAKRVAYMSYQKSDSAGKNFDIFIKDTASGAVQRLDVDEADDAVPAWMADDHTILFDSYRRVDMRAIWKKNVGGGTISKVTNIPKLAFGADCHYDNVRIVFNAYDKSKDVGINRNGMFWKRWKSKMPNIYIINADGSNLLDLNTQGLFPKWSPDGTRIVFFFNYSGNFDIYTIRPDGSDLTRLTSREAEDVEPAWSPCGRYIVFTSNENKNWNLWIIKADGTGLAPLTTHEKFEGGAMWGNDGYIYFHSNDNGNWDIWRLKPAGFVPIPPDIDGDGIINVKDKCPKEAEDVDGFEDEDGCPDTDNDNDGVLDADDQCPDKLEDNDGFQDTAGCPDPDNDNDNIADKDDQCPIEPEDYNAFQDKDGCPDEPPLQKLHPLAVQFKVYRDEYTMESIPLLESLVEKLKNWKEVRVAVRVYTDNVQHRNNTLLTQRRAEKIKEYLVQRGIQPGRVQPFGMGDAAPVASNNTRSGRAQNNRVIIEVLGE